MLGIRRISKGFLMKFKFFPNPPEQFQNIAPFDLVNTTLATTHPEKSKFNRVLGVYSGGQGCALTSFSFHQYFQGFY
jgi:hypothetical protein